MKRSRKSQSFDNSNLVQSDIFTAFNKWKNIASKMTNKTNTSETCYTSSVIIEIDSDSEVTDGIDNFTENSIKRELPVPFSDSEEEDVKGGIRLENNNVSDSETSTPTALRRVIDIRVNKPQSVTIHPTTFSTPLLPDFQINDTHVGINDLSTILFGENDAMTEGGSVDSISSNSTIIYETAASPNKTKSKINIRENLIIRQENDKIKDVNVALTDDQPKQQIDANISVNSPNRKRHFESERVSKQQKVNQQPMKKVSKDKEMKCAGIEKCKNISSKPNVSSDICMPKKACIDAQLQANSKKVSDHTVKGKKNQIKPKLSSSENKNKQNGKVSKTSAKKKLNYSSDDTRRINDSVKSSTREENWIITNCSNKNNSQKNIIVLKKKTAPNEPKGNSEQPSKNKESSMCKKVSNNASLTKPEKTNIKNIQCSDKSENKQSKSKEASNSASKLSQKIDNSNIHSKSANKPGISPTKSQGQNLDDRPTLKSKKEGKTLNIKNLELITNLFKTVYKTQFLKDLVPSDKEKIKLFFNMKMEYQYVCLRLFTRRKRWYNVFKFCQLIDLDILDNDISDLYNFFEEKQIVDTDYTKDDIIKLLYLLDVTDLKSICDRFKCKKKITKKEDMINCLLRYCRTQSTLTNQKSTQDLIKEEIIKKMGKCIRLNENFHDAFYRTYILGTFTNPEFVDLVDYFKNMSLNILFPTYAVHDYCIFYTEGEFLRFARAKQCRDELEKCMGNHIETLRICNTMFKELLDLKDIESQSEDRYSDAPHLIRFTARAVYVSGLSNAVKILATKFPKEAQVWLEYMIKNEAKFTHRIGEWYYHLSWLYMRYLEPRDYKHAAKLIIEVLQDKKEHLSEIQLHQLAKRGELLKATKKYKVDQLYHDIIAELVPRAIDVDKEIPQYTTDAKTVRGNESGRKRGYVFRDGKGNTNFLSVENIALRHYIEDLGYTDGEHCEGSLIKATFILFFWDIIYMDIPGSFISNLQNQPLDMNTKYFYLRRKDVIDKRLKEIESEWLDSEVVKWLKQNYEEHSHESCVYEVGKIIDNPDLLETLVDCIGRRVLAKISERLVKNIRPNRSGMPDLLIWNTNKKTSKFVEVKGENDKLSIGQTLWLKYLKTVGADAEVCHVHSMGSKRKAVKKIQKEDSAVPSTSSCSN